MATYALTVSTSALDLGVISGATVVAERKRTTVTDIYPTSSLYTKKTATNVSGIATIQLEADDGTVFHEIKIFDASGVLVYKNTIQMPPQAADIEDLPLNDIITESATQAVAASVTATTQAGIATEQAVLTAADRVQTGLDVIAAEAAAAAAAADAASIIVATKKFNTYAEQMAYTGNYIDGQKCDVLGYYAIGDGGFIQMYWSASSTAVHNGATVRQPTSVSGAGRWLAVNTSSVSLKQCGAKGDGSTIDDAWSVFCNLDGEGIIEAGTYKITKHVTIDAGVLKTIRGVGNPTLIITLPINTDFLTCNRQVNFEHIKFDFNNGYVKNGITYPASIGEIILKDLTFKNVKDTDSTTGTILINVTADSNKLYIDGIRFSNILKKGNGSITDAAGSLNCIYLGNSTSYALADIKNVFAFEVHNIDAANAVIYEDTAVVYVITSSSDQNNVVNIENIYGFNFGKRLLKIHASNVAMRNISGVSTEGDSLGLVGINNAQGLGEKYGCSVVNAVAIGKMEYAFSSAANQTYYENISATTTVGTKAGMSTGSFGLLINGNGTKLNGGVFESTQCIGIGSTAAIISNTTLNNVTLNITGSTILNGIYDIAGNLGINTLSIDGLVVNYSATAVAVPLFVGQYFNGTTIKGENFNISNVVVKTLGGVNSYGLYVLKTYGVNIENVNYLNTSGNSHFRLVYLTACENTNVRNVYITGTNQIGVFFDNCTGRNSAAYVNNVSASTAAVYNTSSTNVSVTGVNQSQIGTGTPTTYPSRREVRYTSGTTANRPTDTLVAGDYHWDTTLAKPIWWNGSVWKDAANTTV